VRAGPVGERCNRGRLSAGGGAGREWAHGGAAWLLALELATTPGAAGSGSPGALAGFVDALLNAVLRVLGDPAVRQQARQVDWVRHGRWASTSARLAWGSPVRYGDTGFAGWEI
jgi:hypothetical protein